MEADVFFREKIFSSSSKLQYYNQDVLNYLSNLLINKISNEDKNNYFLFDTLSELTNNVFIDNKILKDAAENNLFLAGIFPQYIVKKTLGKNYFVYNGQFLYGKLYNIGKKEIYKNISMDFEKIISILNYFHAEINVGNIIDVLKYQDEIEAFDIFIKNLI